MAPRTSECDFNCCMSNLAISRLSRRVFKSRRTRSGNGKHWFRAGPLFFKMSAVLTVDRAKRRGDNLWSARGGLACIPIAAWHTRSPKIKERERKGISSFDKSLYHVRRTLGFSFFSSVAVRGHKETSSGFLKLNSASISIPITEKSRGVVAGNRGREGEKERERDCCAKSIATNHTSCLKLHFEHCRERVLGCRFTLVTCELSARDKEMVKLMPYLNFFVVSVIYMTRNCWS